MNFLSLLESKRDGHPFESGSLQEAVREYTAGRIPDYQMAALLMAICFRGLTPEETAALTRVMRDSGEVLSFPPEPGPLVDKHSTGGVGDKVSLPLAPLLACLGLRVPMISGRGLGITGGTLDKLDSIPGFKTQLAVEQIVESVQRVGCVICGQTERMVPADRKLYALRDATGTVPSIPLIVASILSKKLAEGIGALVVDVKFGLAAFMRTREDAQELARAMVQLGCCEGVNTRALLTRMDCPLGRAAGNWLEVKEAVECLENRGPADLRELVIACAAQLLVQTGLCGDANEAAATAEACLASGQARARWDKMLEAQGADLSATARKLSADTVAPSVLELRAEREGYVCSCNAKKIGELVRELGGGRWLKDTALDHAVGVDRLAKPGEHVEPGALLGRVHASATSAAERGMIRLHEAFSFCDAPPKLEPLIEENILAQ